MAQMAQIIQDADISSNVANAIVGAMSIQQLRKLPVLVLSNMLHQMRLDRAQIKTLWEKLHSIIRFGNSNNCRAAQLTFF